MVAHIISRDQVLEWLSEVPDPEIPVLTITDLGIVRDVTVDDEVVVALTPTYTGCPATEMIEQSVIDTLHRRGIDKVSIDRVYRHRGRPTGFPRMVATSFANTA